MMNKALLLMLALAAMFGSVFGQQAPPVSIPDSPFLYKSPENYNDCTNTATPVCFYDTDVPNLLPQQHRSVPVRIRMPLNAPAGRLPVILWSHGGLPQPAGRELNVVWGRTLAQAGYIVIHLGHLEFTPEMRQAACVEFGAVDEAECLAFPMATLVRARDAAVVLAGLGWLEQNVPLLNGRIDQTRVAMAGWSGGSITTLAMAGARYRMTAASPDVSFSNPLPKIFLANSTQGAGTAGYKSDSWREITRPVLNATGLGDDTDDTAAAQRLEAFRGLPPGRKYQLYVNDPRSTHDTFNIQNPDFPEANTWIASYSLAFFDAAFKNRNLAAVYLLSNRLPMWGSQKIVKLSRK